MKKLCARVALVILVGVLLVSPSVTRSQAQGLTATFFVAHAGTHEDASVTPIPVLGGRSVTFEVRVREAGTFAKAAWQTRIVLDGCRFVTPAVTDVYFGDYMAAHAPIQVGPEIKLDGNRILIDLGQFLPADAETAASGLLASIVVRARPAVACPDPSGLPPEQVTADLVDPVLAAPTGVAYDVTAFSGRFDYRPMRTVFLPLVWRAE